MDPVDQEIIGRSRPLSPHMTVYRPQITSVLSILHRISGLTLSVTVFVLAYWLWAAAMGGNTYASALDVLGNPLILMSCALASLAFFYHLANGIRHLVWDAGYGLDLVSVRRSAWATAAVATALTAGLWLWLLR